MVKAVVFDHTTLFVDRHKAGLIGQLRALLQRIRDAGLKVVVFSTHDFDVGARLAAYGYSNLDLFLARSRVGVSKGSPQWVAETCRLLRLQPHELFYVGDDQQDWRTAINPGVMYVHALWSKPTVGYTAFSVEVPQNIWNFITHWLLLPPRWEYTLDMPAQGICVRSLLAASTTLPSTRPSANFTLQDIFTYRNNVSVGIHSARDLLMLHALSSLYLEGLIRPNSFFAVYPSSTPNQINPVVQQFVQPAARLFHGYFRDDLLVRAVQAVDSSRARARARQTGGVANISFSNQTNTLHLNPYYQEKLPNRSVIVVDDFTTSGMSLEWARNLLYAGGAQQVVLFTIGKYGYVPVYHTVYSLQRSQIIQPFQLQRYEVDQVFRQVEQRMVRHGDAAALVQRSLDCLRTEQPFSQGD